MEQQVLKLPPRSSSPFPKEKHTKRWINRINVFSMWVITELFHCLLYCRKNHTSPDPDTHKVPTRFWNNILPQSLTPKSFGKGYNNFTSFMPSSYPAFPYKDGQHAHILRSTSDASQSDQSVSSCGNQISERSPPNTPSTSRSPQDGAPFPFTIINNLAT